MEHRDLEGNARNSHFFFSSLPFLFFFLGPRRESIGSLELIQGVLQQPSDIPSKKSAFLSIQSSFGKNIKIPIFCSIYLSLSFEFVILLFRLRFKNRVFKTDDAQFTKLENVEIYRNIIRHQDL